ncbi:MAG: nuclear transport factor 2 family protein [Anaerolineales bacterium]
MSKIIIGKDCGNSPKNILLKDMVVALIKGDTKFFLATVTDDIRWDIIGTPLLEGKEDVAKALERMKGSKDTTLTIKHISTHGKSGAVDGTIILGNEKTLAFCDVFEFSSSTGKGIKEITSYVIERK